jgi:hypothetical protein
MADLVPDWYNKKRAMMEETLDLIQESFPEHKIESVHGSYALVSTPYCFSDQVSLYNFCTIASSNHEKPLDIIRNAANFPFAWVKKHTTKKRKYLVCAEDKNSISVIDLNSWKIHTWLDENDDFCPKTFHPSKSGKYIAIRGSTFGELDSIRIYDFTSPIRFPWIMSGNFDGMFIHEDKKYYPSYIPGWDDDKYLRVVCETPLDDDHTLLTEFMLYTDGDYIFDCQETVKNS